MTWQSARPETERNTKLVNPLENFLMESCNVKTEANTSVSQSTEQHKEFTRTLGKKKTNKLPKG